MFLLVRNMPNHIFSKESTKTNLVSPTSYSPIWSWQFLLVSDCDYHIYFVQYNNLTLLHSCLRFAVYQTGIISKSLKIPQFSRDKKFRAFSSHFTIHLLFENLITWHIKTKGQFQKLRSLHLSAFLNQFASFRS